MGLQSRARCWGCAGPRGEGAGVGLGGERKGGQAGDSGGERGLTPDPSRRRRDQTRQDGRQTRVQAGSAEDRLAATARRGTKKKTTRGRREKDDVRGVQRGRRDCARGKDGIVIGQDRTGQMRSGQARRQMAGGWDSEARRWMRCKTRRRSLAQAGSGLAVRGRGSRSRRIQRLDD